MNKKGYHGGSGMMLVMTLFIGALVVFIMISEIKNETKVVKECKGLYHTEDFCTTLVSAECGMDCKELELEFFRYEYSGSMFGASIKNCFCRTDENEIKQIWWELRRI